MRTIHVEPEQLEAAANRIDQTNEEYVQSYTRLFDAVDTMKGGWQGKDNTAFSTQIGKFMTDFRQMNVLCIQYADFLRSSASSYRNVQDDLCAQINGLGQ